MSKKVTNNLVTDITRIFALDDRTTNNQLNWLLSGFVEYLKKVEDKKQAQMDYILAMASEEQEGSPNEPDWNKLERDYKWQQDQMEVTEGLREYFDEAVKQLFPEVANKAKTQADGKAFFDKIKKAS